jgi:predicted TIM-barrel fold metal-dependent hydrolase
MDVTKPTTLHAPSRRDFLKGLAAAGAGTLLPGAVSGAQAPAAMGRRIDVHQHYSSPAYYDLLVRKNAITVNQFKNYTPERNIEQMEKAGVQVGLVSPTAPAVWFGDVQEARSAARELNEYAVAQMVQKYKGRYGVFATLPMPDVEGTLKEIEYAYDTLKVDGVAFLTSYDDMWLGDKRFDPIFDELNRRNAVVYTHPLEAACCKNPIQGVAAQTLEYPTDTTRIIMSLIVSNTATRCPNIKFIFSHAGGTLVSIAQRFLGNQVTADGLKKPPDANSRLHHVRRFYYDTAGSANPIQLQSLKLLVPTSQIVFGTDFPFGNVPGTANGVQTSGFSESELQGIFRDNALTFLPKYV